MRPPNTLNAYYYVKDRRIRVDKKELQKWCDHLPKAEIYDENTYEFFCDIYYPYVKDNQMMVKLLVDEDRELDIPINLIRSIARAGWPRAGIMAERLIDFPWRLLKPIYELMKEPCDISQLKEKLYKDEVYDDTMVTNMYQKEILSWIEEGIKESLILGTKAYHKMA
jgi:hypothetical protein